MNSNFDRPKDPRDCVNLEVLAQLKANRSRLPATTLDEDHRAEDSLKVPAPPRAKAAAIEDPRHVKKYPLTPDATQPASSSPREPQFVARPKEMSTTPVSSKKEVMAEKDNVKSERRKAACPVVVASKSPTSASASPVPAQDQPALADGHPEKGHNGGAGKTLSSASASFGQGQPATNANQSTMEQPMVDKKRRLLELDADMEARARKHPGLVTEEKRAKLQHLMEEVCENPNKLEANARKILNSDLYQLAEGNAVLFAEKHLDRDKEWVDKLLAERGDQPAGTSAGKKEVPVHDGVEPKAPVNLQVETLQHDQVSVPAIAEGEILTEDDPDYWRSKINECATTSVKACVALGRELIAAKAKLGHGKFNTLFEPGKLRIDRSTANRLMAIARNTVITNSDNYPNLPSAFNSLHVISRLDERRLQKAIDAQKVWPGMTIADARELVASSSPTSKAGAGPKAEIKVRSLIPTLGPDESLVCQILNLIDKAVNACRDDISLGQFLKRLQLHLEKKSLRKPTNASAVQLASEAES